jgi:hypothetical protein
MSVAPYYNNRFSAPSFEQPYNSMDPYSGGGYSHGMGHSLGHSLGHGMGHGMGHGLGHGLGHGYGSSVDSYSMGGDPYFNSQPYGMYNSTGYMNGGGLRQ